MRLQPRTPATHRSAEHAFRTADSPGSACLTSSGPLSVITPVIRRHGRIVENSSTTLINLPVNRSSNLNHFEGRMPEECTSGWPGCRKGSDRDRGRVHLSGHAGWHARAGGSARSRRTASVPKALRIERYQRLGHNPTTDGENDRSGMKENGRAGSIDPSVEEIFHPALRSSIIEVNAVPRTGRR